MLLYTIHFLSVVLIFFLLFRKLNSEKIARNKLSKEVEERKKAEAALKESVDYLSMVFETADNVAFITTDIGGTDTTVLKFSPGAEKLFGYSSDEIVGEKVGKLHLPEDVETFPQLQENMKGGNKGFSGETTLVKRSGEKFLAMFTIHPIFNAEGEVIGTIGVSIDISKRKESARELVDKKEQLELVLKSANIGWWDWDIPSGKEQYNDILPKILGYSPDEVEAHINWWTEKIHADDLELVTKDLEEHFDGKTEFYTNRHRLLRKDGTWRWFFDYGKVVEKDEDGKPIRMIGTLRDIDDIVRSEKEMLNVKKLESVGLLAGGIAHDFNNILSAIFGNIELAMLKMDKTFEEYKYIETANSALEKATSLTKQLLTFAKGGEPILESVDIKVLIKSIVDFNLSGGTIKANYDIEDDLWQVRADKGQLSQVITNLLVNAKEAMPDGGNIFITAKNSGEKASEMVKITLQDEGSGIDPEHLQNIFDPYFTTSPGGSGLGLATVYNIVRKHHGSISVDSKPGEGASFSILIPAETSDPLEIKPKKTTPVKDIEPQKILIMDDDAIILDLITAMLKIFGHSSFRSTDGEQAVKMYKEAFESGEPYDIVITDLTVPGGMGGKETVERISLLNPEAKVIVASGYSTDPVLSDYSRYGFSGRLIKPFNVDDLRNELIKVTEGS